MNEKGLLSIPSLNAEMSSNSLVHQLDFVHFENDSITLQLCILLVYLDPRLYFSNIDHCFIKKVVYTVDTKNTCQKGDIIVISGSLDAYIYK